MSNKREEYVAYSAGREAAEHDARAAAFSAIRRAATCARRNDALAINHRRIVQRMVEKDPACLNVGHETASRHRRSAQVHEGRADSIRFAIRSAIRSPWLMIEPGMSRRDP